MAIVIDRVELKRRAQDELASVLTPDTSEADARRIIATALRRVYNQMRLEQMMAEIMRRHFRNF